MSRGFNFCRTLFVYGPLKDHHDTSLRILTYLCDLLILAYSCRVYFGILSDPIISLFREMKTPALPEWNMKQQVQVMSNRTGCSIEDNIFHHFSFNTETEQETLSREERAMT